MLRVERGSEFDTQRSFFSFLLFPRSNLAGNTDRKRAELKAVVIPTIKVLLP